MPIIKMSPVEFYMKFGCAYYPTQPTLQIEDPVECKRLFKEATLALEVINHLDEIRETLYYYVKMVQDPALMVPKSFFVQWLDYANGIQALYADYVYASQPVLVGIKWFKSHGWTLPRVKDWLERHRTHYLQPLPKPKPQLSTNLQEGKEPRTLQDLMSKRGWKE